MEKRGRLLQESVSRGRTVSGPPLGRWVIYALADPRRPLFFRYVGWTVNVSKRMVKHLLEAPRKVTHKERWLARLLEQGHKPHVQVLEHGTGARWEERERWWISTLKKQGHDLTNGTKGGDGTIGRVQSKAERKKRSAALLGKPKSDVHRARIAKAHEGSIPWAAIRAAARARTGRKMPLSTRKKIAATLTGRERPPEVRKKISMSLVGHPSTATSRKGARITGQALLNIRKAQRRRRLRERTEKR